MFTGYQTDSAGSEQKSQKKPAWYIHFHDPLHLHPLHHQFLGIGVILAKGSLERCQSSSSRAWTDDLHGQESQMRLMSTEHDLSFLSGKT